MSNRKPRLLVAVSARDTLHKDLLNRSRQLLDALLQNPDNKAVFKMDAAYRLDTAPETPAGALKFYHQARARNELISASLTPDHDYVLWIDADLVEYPSNLPHMLYKTDPESVIAPLVLLEGDRGGTTIQFYDTLGFIESGRRIRHMPPYFNQRGTDVVELDSVGCVYMLPAEILRNVAYSSEPYDPTVDMPEIARTGHTDHMPVMRYARESGYRVLCDTRVVATHAYLPNYGERFH